jgi:hypothetical protein
LVFRKRPLPTISGTFTPRGCKIIAQRFRVVGIEREVIELAVAARAIAGRQLDVLVLVDLDKAHGFGTVIALERVGFVEPRKSL